MLSSVHCIMDIIIKTLTIIFSLTHAIPFGPELTNLKIFYTDDDYKNEANEELKRASNETKRHDSSESYCQSFSNCRDCTNSSWYPCTWCHDVGCIGSPGKTCNNNLDRNDQNLISRGQRCPSISHAGPILLPAGVRTNIKVKLFAPEPQIIHEKEILCELNLKQKLIHMKGMVMKNTVHCYPVTLSTKQNGEIETGLLRLMWGGADPYSNVLPVVVYRCESLAQDCDSCRVIPPEYGCGWCDIYNSCILGDKCVNNFIKWALNRLSCDAFNRKLYYV